MMMKKLFELIGASPILMLHEFTTSKMLNNKAVEAIFLIQSIFFNLSV